MYYSPKTSTDGLVFHYDTGNTVRSYLGKPTTNRFSTEITDPTLDSLAIGNGAGSNPQLGSGGTCAVALFNGEKVLAINRGTSSGVYYENRVYWTIALTAGNYYSWSAWVYSTVAGPQLALEYFGGDYNWGVAQSYNTHTGTGWERLYAYASAPASSNTQTYCFIYVNTNNNIYAKDFQLENQQYPTQFTTGTRSATQGLKDLTGSKTISLSTVSFDSNAQMTFDGTDDTLDTGIPLTALPALSNFTIECLVKIDAYPTAAPANGYGSTTRCGVLIGAAYYSGTALYWYGNSSGTACTIYAYIRGADAYRTAGGFNLTPGRYHHLVLVNDYSGGTIKLYANGTLNGSASTATQEYNPGLTPSAGNIGISKAQVDGGGEAVYSYLPCQVPSVKIFNRALTADEVARNFNAIKSRFNIE